MFINLMLTKLTILIIIFVYELLILLIEKQYH